MALPPVMATPARYNHDPLASWTEVPANETPEERRMRLAVEEHARRVSMRIDEEIKAEKAALKKREGIVRVLVLGQSESGKSTTIKNFQLAYAHQAWIEDRLSWRCVIFLNLVRSVNKILQILTTEMTRTTPPTPPPSPVTTLPQYRLSGDTDTDADTNDNPRSSCTVLCFTDQHKLLSMRLAPLIHVQRDLEQQIGAGAAEIVSTGASYEAAPFTDAERFGSGRPPRRPTDEFAVRSTWKEALTKLRTRTSISSHEHKVTNKKLTEVMGIIAMCSGDIKALWSDETVKDVLNRRNMRIQESSGFFLDDVDRIVSRSYEPTDNDILRARLRTVGVQEYTFTLEKGQNDILRSADRFGREIGRQWLMFDVGGARTSRDAWFPYFDDINALIFLAPIACFDETLEEDSTVNRIEDSLLLWKGVCNSQLLVNVQFVLFLNKCDLLSKKLNSANVANVRDHFPAFGDQRQNLKNIGAFFRGEFREVLRQSHPTKPLAAHMTSVTNVKSTASTLRTVRDGIVQSNLASANFI